MSKVAPFFSNFIESQSVELTAEELKKTAGGSLQDLIDQLPKDYEPPHYVTMKAPSDDDEGATDIELFGSFLVEDKN